jgi:hypothetical protein
MKKIILIAAMLISVAISANDFNGLWESEDTTYHKVILLNNDEFNFINFSFTEQQELKEVVINVTDNYIKTRIYNPENGWTVFIEYSVVDKNTLISKFTGDITASTFWKLKQIE